MPQEFQGSKTPPRGKFAIAVSRYHEPITRKLLEGSVKTLIDAGVRDEDVIVAWAPGAFELPVVAHHVAASGQYVAVICLGAVIRGETTHDQQINRAVSMGVTEVSLRTGVPVLFGILTCDTLEQAINRAGGNVGNKGVEAATAAIEMSSLLEKLR